MSIEGVLLTGGKSARMGADKASIIVNGETLSHLVAKGLLEHCDPLTVVGLEPLPLPNADFIRDQEEYQGPLVALSLVEPSSPFVFVASCDLVRFDPKVVGYLATRIGDAKAAMVMHDGFPQPLCALYQSEAFKTIKTAFASGERKLIRWASNLDPVFVSQDDLKAVGLDPRCFMGANTPEELSQLLVD